MCQFMSAVIAILFMSHLSLNQEPQRFANYLQDWLLTSASQLGFVHSVAIAMTPTAEGWGH